MRIASLLSAATETLFALGLGEQVVAISHECDYPPEALRLPRVTRSLIDSSCPSGQIDEQVKERLAAGDALYEIDRELLRELAPDLIITQAQCDVCAVRYQDVVDCVQADPTLATTRIVALNPSSLADILHDVVRIGEAAGVSARAQRFVGLLNQRIGAVTERLGAARRGSMPPSVVCLEWLDPLMTAGNWTPELIELAGGCSCLAKSGKHSEYVSWEEVRAVDPEVLIVAPCGFDLARSKLESRRLHNLIGFPDLSAVRRGRAYVIDGNAYLNRSGPRIVNSLEILANLIHPDCFPAPSRFAVRLALSPA